MPFKLGKKPARPWQAPGSKFRLGSYLAGAALPPLPSTFGHQSLIGQWGMLANDRVGCCVIAGGDHETMLFNAEAGHVVSFVDANTLGDYRAVSRLQGDNPPFDPTTLANDNGCDVQVAANYRRKTGLVDASGKRHTVAAYLALDPGDTDHLLLASYLFSAVGIGLALPSSAIDQTKKGQTWDVVSGSPNEGGHYVPLVGRLPSGALVSVSWGQTQLMTARFFQTFCDEAVAYVSTEDLVNQKSPENFSYADLISDLAALA
jgi:hypothetical protein